MQFVRNGPDIPERLLQAHEDGRVVFFCRAGISYPARLPGLFAYCGGWQSHPFSARCGNTPLTIVRHSSCSACEKLICDNCGHCSKSCGDCMPRQATIAGMFPSIETPADGEW
jgi:hypothetical protein